MKKNQQMSDSLPVCLLLALSGGCMDAYSYLCRGGVFANAQTGNMLLFGVNLAGGNLHEALKYLWPILAFTCGVILSDLIRYTTRSVSIHWRQLSIVLEFLVLLLVCWFPQSMNALANILISFVCGIQVESFRSVNGASVSTTMCIGNLRSGTYYLDKFFQTRRLDYLKKAGLYYSVILFFILGAVAESILIPPFSEKSLLLSVVLLIIVCLLMIFPSDEPSPTDL